MFNLLLSFLITISTLINGYEFGVTMAVDMGSDSYKIALTRPGNYMEIVLNTESNRKTLNSIGFSSKERFVGDAASTSARKFPDSTFRHPQFLMGQAYNSPLAQIYHQRFPLVQLQKHNTSDHIIFNAKNFNAYFSPEALVSMIFSDAQMSAKAFSKTNVRELALVVRAFTDQTRRFYYKKAADIAKIKLVEILDSNVATGIKYLISKLDKLSSKAQHVMIVDVGAYHTDATVYECQEMYEHKNKKKSYPSCTIIGYGYTFKGVADIDKKIMEVIINKFEQQSKVKYYTIGNPRRNFTLMEEAKRIKKVLTSVDQTKISLESFYQDEDFYSTIKLSEVESHYEKYVESMLDAVDQSLKSSNKTTNHLVQVILMGGGSRIPLVQTIIKRKTKAERLSNILNTDEDAVLGATFILASKSTFFKVKKIVVNKAAVFPIVVAYNKTETGKDGLTTDKYVEKLLYKHMQPTTHGKVLTVKNVTKNFSVYLKYGDIPSYYDTSFMNGSDRILCKYDINGVEDAVNSYNESYYLDMIRLHASFDRLGIVTITSAEAIFYRKESASTFDKIKEKVSNLFVNKKDEEISGDMAEQNEDIPDSSYIDDLNSTMQKDTLFDDNKTKSEVLNKTDNVLHTDNTTLHDHYNSTVNSDKENNLENKDHQIPHFLTNLTNSTSHENITTTPKPKKLVKKFKHYLSLLSNKAFIQLPSDDEISYYKAKIGEIRRKEIEKEQNAAALSRMESFINECKYGLENDGKFYSYVNNEERTQLLTAVEEKSAWFDENGYLANATINNDARKELNKTFTFVYDRIQENNRMEDLVKNSLPIVKKMMDFVDLINNSTTIIKERFNMTSFSSFSNNLKNLREMITTDYDEWKKKKPWEKKPFTSSDVVSLIDKVQSDSVEHIATFTAINKEMERKMKEEEERKKRKAKEKESKTTKNLTDPIENADNSTAFTTPLPEGESQIPANFTFTNNTTNSPKDEL